MEDLEGLKKFWKNKKVLITGHTGFKGAWLTLWLLQYKAKIIGVSLKNSTTTNLFDQLRLDKRIKSYNLDINNYVSLEMVFKKHRPDLVFHLAAQSLVIKSYNEPINTYNTNVIGTLNVLEAIRKTSTIKCAVIVTSDKCYDSTKPKRFNENDRLGGSDMYSSSKGAAEILINSYRETFFRKNHYPQIASVRAGNVIGGGDWAEDRIVPDLVRAFETKRKITIRNPKATRPWQHVLDPLYGYILLSRKMYIHKGKFNEAWNFGPKSKNKKNVLEVAFKFFDHWGLDRGRFIVKKNHISESQTLSLSSSKARKYLSWQSIISFEEAIKLTAKWYLKYLEKSNLYEECKKQIYYYEEKLKK